MKKDRLNGSRRLLKTDEAAALLAICQRSLWAKTKRGEIRCVRLGRSVRYDTADLWQAVEAHKEDQEG